MREEFRNHFCKENNLPIKVFESPIFEDRLKLLDPLYKSLSKAQVFEVETVHFAGIDDYRDEYTRIKEEAAARIQSSEAYKRLITTDFNVYRVPPVTYNKSKVYSEEHSGDYFLGFDLIQANFNAMKYFDNEIVGGFDTYEEFIGQFTDMSNIINSKYVRQVIFGMCCPNRQVTLERYLMHFIYSEIERLGLSGYVTQMSEDEIILNIKEHAELETAIQNVALKHGFQVRAEKYRLYKCEGANAYFKVFSDGTVKQKCGSSIDVPFVMRAYLGQDVTDNDKVFMYEGRKSLLLDYPEIKIPKLVY